MEAEGDGNLMNLNEQINMEEEALLLELCLYK